MSNEISNVDDTADDTSINDINGSSSKDKLGANPLAADHDLSGSTLQDIQDYLNSGRVSAGDTIYLGTGTWNSGNWDPYNGQIQVSIPNLTIRGGTSDNPDGFANIIAGSKIFQLNSPGITLSNIRFSNTDVQAPCCAVTVQSYDCTIQNCSFDNCHSQNGGAIQGSASAYNNKITDCNFTNCVSINSASGGAIYYQGSNLNVSNCYFANNHVDGWGGGGAIALEGANSEVANCTFINNSAVNGGAIYLHATGLSVTNCNFENNNGTYGGAIHSNSVGNDVTHCNFTANRASEGGAIQLGGDNNDFDIEHCIFEDNHAYATQNDWGYSGGNGGAINAANHNEVNHNILNVTFINNTADVAGGAVRHHSNWTFNNCSFINNSANPNANTSLSDNIDNGGGALWCCEEHFGVVMVLVI